MKVTLVAVGITIFLTLFFFWLHDGDELKVYAGLTQALLFFTVKRELDELTK